ncbi:hypothetical protein [Sphingomonas sp.]|uniref:hypothetical protein n=1 Tax=Sphingomonas sp. TaxID=28214 RepID=UPI0025E55B1A|nr:hypothetical protein [Sphingomonas sp.]
MHRLTREQITTMFVVALATADKVALSRFRSKKRLDIEAGCEKLAAALAAKLDNDSSMVIVTEIVPAPEGGIQCRPGKWGVDEPDPMICPIV